MVNLNIRCIAVIRFLQIKVYLERKSLALALNDAKTAIEELNRLASGVLAIVIVIVWLLMMGLLNTKILVFISSQLLVAVFIFGNTAKTVFEAIIFVFVMHPFDVGDRCVIDGVQVSLLISTSFHVESLCKYHHSFMGSLATYRKA